MNIDDSVNNFINSPDGDENDYGDDDNNDSIDDDTFFGCNKDDVN